MIQKSPGRSEGEASEPEGCEGRNQRQNLAFLLQSVGERREIGFDSEPRQGLASSDTSSPPSPSARLGAACPSLCPSACAARRSCERRQSEA
eukprot:1547969-Rhodomonas_salina.1